MKKLISFLLATCMVGACLTACGSGGGADLKKEIVGVRWEYTEVFPEEVNTMLESYLFEPEEIAYANVDDFAFYRVLTFNEDGTVTVEYDTEKIRSEMYDALDNFMGTLYEHRQDLVDIYGQDFLDTIASEEEFKDAMAYVLGELDSGDELLTYFADNVVTYYFGANEYTSNSGTYEIVDSKVRIEVELDQNEELTFDAENFTLTTTHDEVYVGTR